MQKLFLFISLFFSVASYSQNVGIGTETPTEKLEVNGNIKSGTATGNAMMGSHPTFQNNYAAWWRQGSEYSMLTDGTNTWLNAPATTGSLYLRTGNNNLFTISGSTGNVGAGTTGPVTAFEVSRPLATQLRVTSTNNTGPSLELVNTVGRSWRLRGTGLLTISYTGNSFVTATDVIDIDPVAQCLEPYADNTMQLGQLAYRWTRLYATNGVIQTSDARLKKDITEVKYGVETLMKLKPVSYKWKDGSNNGRSNLGFLAQDVAEIIPEAVYHEESKANPAKENAKANLSDAYGMNYSELIPVLVKSIQEQQKVIEELKTQVKDLQSQAKK